MRDEWIWIPNWDGPEGFQHYKERDPIWIKNYTRLLSHDGYRDLSMHRRGILHGLWMAYAASNRRVRGSTLTLTRQLGQRVLTRDLVSLCDAGFIEILDSAALADRYPSRAPAHSQELETEKEVEEEPLPREVSSSSTRSEETPTPHQPLNGRAALDTDDIPLTTPPHFNCPHCGQVEPTWGDYQTHLAIDHASAPEGATP